MVLKESKARASLAFAKHKPSTSRPALCCHAPLCSSPSAMQAHSLHHLYLRGTVNTQHGNAKLGGGSRSHFYQGSLLQQPKLLTAAPMFALGSLDILKTTPSSPEKTSLLSPGQETQLPHQFMAWGWAWKSDSRQAASSLQPDRLRLRPARWAPRRQSEPFVCVLCPGVIPWEPQHKPATLLGPFRLLE